MEIRLSAAELLCDCALVDNMAVLARIARRADSWLAPSSVAHWRQLHCPAKRETSPYSTAERTVPEPIPALGSQPAGDVSHKPGGRLPLLSARPALSS